MNREKHWESIYRTKPPTEVSWYQPEAQLSLELIRRVAPELDASVLDVGGGASTLVDGLLNSGYRDVTVLDLAPAALARAQERLSERAASVHWVAADVLDSARPPPAPRPAYEPPSSSSPPPVSCFRFGHAAIQPAGLRMQPAPNAVTSAASS